MPAKDLYHDAVKSALIKDNWAIIADPYHIQYKVLTYMPISPLNDRLRLNEKGKK